jgi:hypothetical protein
MTAPSDEMYSVYRSVVEGALQSRSVWLRLPHPPSTCKPVLTPAILAFLWQKPYGQQGLGVDRPDTRGQTAADPQGGHLQPPPSRPCGLAAQGPGACSDAPRT